MRSSSSQFVSGMLMGAALAATSLVLAGLPRDRSAIEEAGATRPASAQPEKPWVPVYSGSKVPVTIRLPGPLSFEATKLGLYRIQCSYQPMTADNQPDGDPIEWVVVTRQVEDDPTRPAQARGRGGAAAKVQKLVVLVMPENLPPGVVNLSPSPEEVRLTAARPFSPILAQMGQDQPPVPKPLPSPQVPAKQIPVMGPVVPTLGSITVSVFDEMDNLLATEVENIETIGVNPCV